MVIRAKDGAGSDVFINAIGLGTQQQPKTPVNVLADINGAFVNPATEESNQAIVDLLSSGILDIAGTVEVHNFPLVQTVDGTVNVGNFPTTQGVTLDRAGTQRVGNVTVPTPGNAVQLSTTSIPLKVGVYLQWAPTNTGAVYYGPADGVPNNFLGPYLDDTVRTVFIEVSNLNEVYVNADTANDRILYHAV